MQPVFTSVFGTVPVIVFRNKNLGNEIHSLACENVEVVKSEIARLEAMDHIEIIAKCDAVYVTQI